METVYHEMRVEAEYGTIYEIYQRNKRNATPVPGWDERAIPGSPFWTPCCNLD